MPLLHIEHPEDSILTGDLDVLSWFSTPGRLSVKIDGSPAIVWGTDPKDGQFFVGTKSVFNKKTPKLIKSIKESSWLGMSPEIMAAILGAVEIETIRVRPTSTRS